MTTATYTTEAGYETLTPVTRGTGTMGNFFSFNSDASVEELALESPDEAEQQDLKRHATRCALRYRSLKNALTGLGDRQRRIEIIILVVGVWIIATSPAFRDMLKSLLGF